MKHLTTLLFLISASLFSQYEFEPSTEFPFGQPNPEAPQQIKDFEPMIGVCNCKSQSRNQDGSWAKPIDMIWRFKYIMNGMAIQDETLKADGRHSGSIRQFQPDSSKWYVHYYASASYPKILPAWEGKKENGKITLYRAQKSPNGAEGYFRLCFYDMSNTGYKWIGEWVDSSEKIVYPTWKIECSRK